jgi:hypothetical protein
MTDDGGVLGNLPRSRPGQRSEKRTGRTAAKAAARAERTDSEAAAPAKTTAHKEPVSAKTTARKEPASARTTGPRESASAGDPVGDAVRIVTGVAATGARVAGGVAREVLRRLPRP